MEFDILISSILRLIAKAWATSTNNFYCLLQCNLLIHHCLVCFNMKIWKRLGKVRSYNPSSYDPAVLLVIQCWQKPRQHNQRMSKAIGVSHERNPFTVSFFQTNFFIYPHSYHWQNWIVLYIVFEKSKLFFCFS